MLVANPGQTPYTLITKKPCHNKPARNNAVFSSTTKYTQSSSTTITQPTSTAALKTMAAIAAIPPCTETNSLKTVSVRINREADLLKHTVQKALISKIPSHISSVLNLYTVPPTNAHRYPERTESLSVDSLRPEMCHFKPIRTVPTTPNKRSKGVIIKIPSARLALKKIHDCDVHERPKPSLNLTPMALSTPRISAFSYVALIRKNSAGSQDNQKHKAKDKTSQICRKANEENLLFDKGCTQQGGMLVKSIGAISMNANIKDEINSPTSDRHRTRRVIKTSTINSIVELQNDDNSPEDKNRATRKRQQISETEHNIQTKNAKLSKDCINSTKSGKKRSSATGSRRPSRRTPPVTRSRLKQIMTLTRKQNPHQLK